MKKNNGFTLAELLIAIAILIFLVGILIGILNSTALVGKANDSTRKKDLDRIKKSFEEYFNDRGNYPLDVNDWNIKENCKSSIFRPYLNPWPCDPDGDPYDIVVGNDGKYFKILTDLEDKSDDSIPVGWYDKDSLYSVEGHSIDEVNYGVSSSNVLWYSSSLSEDCSFDCYQLSAAGKCNSAVEGCNDADGLVDCYRDSGCRSDCKVHCCGAGCN